MKSHFISSGASFEFLLNGFNIFSLPSFNIHPEEWEFHTDDDAFVDVLAFSAVLRGFVKTPKTLEFSISALINSTTNRVPGTQLERSACAILIPLGVFTRYSVRETSMMAAMSKNAAFTTLSYSRII
jgi:hypothetical protein